MKGQQKVPNARNMGSQEINNALKIKLADQVLKTDGWQNIFTGVGRQGIDKRMSTTFSSMNPLREDEVDSLYRQNGLARRMIDLPCNEMTREWFQIPQDVDGIIMEELDRLNAKNGINWLAKMAKLTGGAIAIMGIDDGQDLDMPLFKKGIRNIYWLKVYDRFRININETNLMVVDPMQPSILTPEYYHVNPVHGHPFKAHYSRVLRLDGQQIMDKNRIALQGFNDSDLQAPFHQLRATGGTLDSTEFIIADYVTSTITVKGLQDLLQTQDGEKAILKRLNIIDLSRHIMNTLLLDEDETFTKVTSTLSNLDKVLEVFIRILCATAQPMIPERLFIGYAPGGLSNSGEADIQNWYDSIAALQKNWLQPMLRKLVQIIMWSKDGPTRGAELDGWEIDFKSLWQPTDEQLEKSRLITAQRDKIYIDSGVLTPEEVAVSRFSNDKYSTETELLTSDIKERMALEPPPVLVKPSQNPDDNFDWNDIT